MTIDTHHAVTASLPPWRLQPWNRPGPLLLTWLNRSSGPRSINGIRSIKFTGYRCLWSVMTVTSHERHGVPNHRQLGCLLISCPGEQQRTHQSLALLTLYKGNQPMTDGLPLQRAKKMKSISMSLWQCYRVDLNPNSQVHWANMLSIWGRQDPGGPHVGPMNLAIWVPNEITLFIRQLSLYQVFRCQL